MVYKLTWYPKPNFVDDGNGFASAEINLDGTIDSDWPTQTAALTALQQHALAHPDQDWMVHGPGAVWVVTDGTATKL